MREGLSEQLRPHLIREPREAWAHLRDPREHARALPRQAQAELIHRLELLKRERLLWLAVFALFAVLWLS